MTYERFERLVLSVGAVVIIGVMLVSVGRQAVIEELIGQVVLLCTLIGAVHWGRKGGFVAAVAASLAYFAVRVPTVVAAGGMNLDIASMLGIRIAAYGIIGILGGELCGRMRYVLARLEDSSSVDECTRVYNQAAIGRSLAVAHGQFVRYDIPCAVVIVTLSPRLTADLRPIRQRTLLRRVADHIRNDVRLVDEIGRLGDGAFMLVLPHTSRAGGLTAAERLRNGLREMLGAREESVTVEVFGAPENLDAIESMVERYAGPKPRTAPPADQESVA